jgi:hypothetical protein
MIFFKKKSTQILKLEKNITFAISIRNDRIKTGHNEKNLSAIKKEES